MGVNHRTEMIFKLYDMPLPSGPKLQGLYWTESPTHGLPPLLGTGLVHARFRCLTPAPGSAPHLDQVPHLLQLPCCAPNVSHASLPSHPTLKSTAKKRRYHFVMTKNAHNGHYCMTESTESRRFLLPSSYGNHHCLDKNLMTI